MKPQQLDGGTLDCHADVLQDLVSREFPGSFDLEFFQYRIAVVG
jgi:hypothetical protein